MDLHGTDATRIGKQTCREFCAWSCWWGTSKPSNSGPFDFTRLKFSVGPRFSLWRATMLACCIAGADPQVRPQLEVVCSVSETQQFFFTLQTLPPPAAPAASTKGIPTITVAVPTKNFATLGLQLELTETRAPTVLGIEEGAIEEFNRGSTWDPTYAPLTFCWPLMESKAGKPFRRRWQANCLTRCIWPSNAPERFKSLWKRPVTWVWPWLTQINLLESWLESSNALGSWRSGTPSRAFTAIPLRCWTASLNLKGKLTVALSWPPSLRRDIFGASQCWSIPKVRCPS